MWRNRAGLTQARLAELALTSQQHVARMDKRQDLMTWDWALKFAPFLGCEPEDLVVIPPTVPVVGRAGAGAEIFPIDDYPVGHGADRVVCPRGMDPKSTLAVEVVGDSMYPDIEEGHVVFFTPKDDPVPVECIGARCVVKLKHDGPTLIKRVRRGSTAGLYDLESQNAPTRKDVELEWAARAVAIPADLVERTSEAAEAA